MKTRSTLFVFLLLASLLGTAPAHAEFLSVSDDIPLMTGLAETPDGTMIFDVPDGRIAEVTASGAANKAAVRTFYGDTLPQLGWRAAGGDAWVREGEQFRLEFPEPGLVRFVIAPKGNAQP